MADMPNMEKSTGSLTSEGEETNGGNLRRDSTGGQTIIEPSPSPATSEEKVLPHYLRASTGSCHDFCKNGRNHVFESKGKFPVYLSFLKNENTKSKEDRIEKSNGNNGKQWPPIKLLTPPASLDAKSSSMKGFSNKKKLLKLSASLDLRGGSVGDSYKNSRGLLETVGNKLDKQSSSLSLLISPGHGNANLRSQKVGSKSYAASKPKLKTASPETSVSKQESASKSRDRSRKATGETIFKDIGISEIKETREVILSTHSLSPPRQDHGLASLTPTKYKSKRSSAASQSPKLEFSSRSLSVSKKKLMITKVPSSSSWRNSERPNKVKEPKDTPPTKEKSEVKPAGSSLNSRPPRLVRLGSKKYRNVKNGVRDHGETGSKEEVGLSARDKGRLRNSGMARPEKKDNTPENLKFRRGRVLNVQAETSGLMWLSFEQGRATENEGSKFEEERRSFRRTEVETGSSDTPTTPAVVLRHQDVQVKKDIQDFNQVIEETANKLVETRKSKVKALVSAFETLISLQDSKPAR